jgi:16S rRNA (cytidine1402-2'-O)-methyltransferase
MAGTLYLVTTPIGNPEDITYRAVRVLRSADLIAAEDPGTAKILLDRYDVATPMTSYPAPSLEEKVRVLLARLNDGQDVAVICDVGTPVLWDPGARLVQAAVAAGIRTVPIPGPSAALAALPVSGFAAESFYLHGPMPQTMTASRRLLERLRTQPGTLVFFVMDTKLLPTLRLIHRVLGPRRVAVAADVTQQTERFVRGRVDEVLRILHRRTVTGEITLLIAGRNGKTSGRRKAPKRR